MRQREPGLQRPWSRMHGRRTWQQGVSYTRMRNSFSLSLCLPRVGHIGKPHLLPTSSGRKNQAGHVTLASAVVSDKCHGEESEGLLLRTLTSSFRGRSALTSAPDPRPAQRFCAQFLFCFCLHPTPRHPARHGHIWTQTHLCTLTRKHVCKVRPVHADTQRHTHADTHVQTATPVHMHVRTLT